MSEVLGEVAMTNSRRSGLATLFLVVAGCGSRTGLGLLSLTNDVSPSNGGSVSTTTPGEGGTISIGAAGFVGGAPTAGAASTGGRPSLGGQSAGGVTVVAGAGGTTVVAGTGGAPGAGQGGGGGTPAADDPTTLGDERPGFVECRGGKLTLETCQPPTVCCQFAGCIAKAKECQATPLTTCDGPEDCPRSQVCCLNGGGFLCQAKCTTRTLRHLECGGPCADTDDDRIPDPVDACVITQFEDGKGPFPEDGCSEYDGDGVVDGLDQCPNEMEDGLPPRPDDGCR